MFMQVANIEVKQVTPVDHGEIICFSIYSGPQADFGNGKSCIWVDVLDGGNELLLEFEAFFKDPDIKKVNKYVQNILGHICDLLSLFLSFPYLSSTVIILGR